MWQSVHIPENQWNVGGAYVFSVYPGQNAALTVVDRGYDHERFEVFNNGVSMGVSVKWGVADPTYHRSTYDAALAAANFDRFTAALPPGDYRLTFRNRRTKDFVYDWQEGAAVYAGIKVEITETPDGDEDRLADQFESNTGIYLSPVDTGTDPTRADTDGDGLGDREEVFVTLTDPNKADTDGDGFLDSAEIAAGKSPTDPNSKPEQIEIRTAIEITINTELGKSYQIERSEDLTNWVTLPEVIVGDGRAVTKFYSTKDYPGRFYRSAVVPIAE
ncbi:MAG: hypothetical protein EOP84_09355 [Verrucomicrobiaceae bacterium]|nr:MAG: hypothetical protein EOP84_09355 [Verrucomicrobiaceae bacterium]